MGAVRSGELRAQLPIAVAEGGMVVEEAAAMRGRPFRQPRVDADDAVLGH